MATLQRADRTFVGISSVVFATSAAATILWCSSMSPAMPMPGGWTMSMAWMPMPGGTWMRAAASFAGMWAAMTVAMMLPSLLPVLWRYRSNLAEIGTPADWLAAAAAAGYFFVWILVGVVLFPVGAALSAATMSWPALARATPISVGVIVIMAGALQFTSWKARHLACCRAGARSRGVPRDAAAAWRLGVHSGVHCCCACAGLTAILLAVGVMSFSAMAAVTVAAAAERVAPDGERAAKVIGAVAMAAGLWLLARAACQ